MSQNSSRFLNNKTYVLKITALIILTDMFTNFKYISGYPFLPMKKTYLFNNGLPNSNVHLSSVSETDKVVEKDKLQYSTEQL